MVKISVRVLLGLSTAYFLLLIKWMLDSTITFGVGLGDLFYFYLSMGFSVLFLITFIFSLREWKNKPVINFYSISAILAILILLLFTYDFTIGRGSELPWNGTVFNP